MPSATTYDQGNDVDNFIDRKSNAKIEFVINQYF